MRNVGGMDLQYLTKLLRGRTPASFALLLLLVLDEIEALVFVGLALAFQRVDLFEAFQPALFPAAFFVAAAASIARHAYHRRERERRREELVGLAKRIGALP